MYQLRGFNNVIQHNAHRSRDFSADVSLARLPKGLSLVVVARGSDKLELGNHERRLIPTRTNHT